MWRSSNARRTPMCANPLSPPPPRTSAMRRLTGAPWTRMGRLGVGMSSSRSNAVPGWRRGDRSSAEYGVNCSKGGHRRMSALHTPQTIEELLQVLVQPVQPHDGAAHGDDRAGTVTDDQSGEHGGA